MKNRMIQNSILNIKKYSFFYNLFLYISLFVMVIIISSTIITNRIYSRNIYETIETSNSKILSLTSHNIEFMHHTIDSFLLRLSNDIQVDLIMYTEKTPENALDLYRLMEVMSSYKTNTDFIQSFYIYNGISETYYCVGNSNVVRSSGEMHDENIVEIIEGLTIDKSKIFLLPRTISDSPYTDHKTEEVYTYVLPRFDQKTKELAKAYVVNVKADWVEDSIQAMSGKNLVDKSSLIVLHNDGMVMAHSSKDLFGVDMSGEGYIEAIRNSDSQEGTITWNIDGQSNIISYNKLGVKDVLLISLTEEEHLYAELRLINMLTIIIMCSLIVIGLVASFLLSKAFYKPILNLKSNLQLLFENQRDLADGSQNEFHAMRSMFEDMHHDLKNLQSFKNVNINTLKEQFILSLLNKKIMDVAEVEKKCKGYELNVSVHERAQLIIMTIDHYYDLVKVDEPGSIIRMMREIISEKLSKIYDVEIVHYENTFIAILNTPIGTGLTSEHQDGLDLMRIIQQVVKTESNFGITITIGPFIQSVDGLWEAYQLTNKLSQSRLIKGHESLLVYLSDRDNMEEQFVLPVEETKRMLDYFKAQDEVKCFEACKSMISTLPKYDTQDVKLGISYIMLSIIDTINTISTNAHLSFEVEFNGLNQYVHSLETLDEVSEFFCETMGKVIFQMKENKSSRGKDLVVAIKTYIEVNYSDYAMTPNIIASSQGLTLKYANTLFKKDTGLSISAYINDFRLEEAAKMLLDTQQSVEYILDGVGWENSPYFYTLFKKKFGVTPTIYRVRD